MDTTDAREYAAKLRQGDGNSMVAAEYIDGLSLWVETLLDGIEEMKRYGTHCIDNSATLELASAKEEIERLKSEVAEFDGLAYNNGEAYNKQYLLREAAESSLASAKEEIVRMREQECATEKERRYWYDLAGKAESALTAERKETERLREALKRYGEHDEDCDIHGNPLAECSCGLDEAFLPPQPEA